MLWKERKYALDSLLISFVINGRRVYTVAMIPARRLLDCNPESTSSALKLFPRFAGQRFHENEKKKMMPGW